MIEDNTWLSSLEKSYSKWMSCFGIIIVACLNHYVMQRYEHNLWMMLVLLMLALMCVFGYAHKYVNGVRVRVWREPVEDLINMMAISVLVCRSMHELAECIMHMMYFLSLMYILFGEKWWEFAPRRHDARSFSSKNSAIVYGVLICVMILAIIAYIIIDPYNVSGYEVTKG